MAGKRKIIRQRTSRKTTSEPADAEAKKKPKTLMDFGFTKQEEEEPLSTHIKPSPNKSPRSRSLRKRAEKEEDEKPLAVDAKCPPKKSPRSRSPRKKSKKEKEEDPVISSPEKSSSNKSPRGRSHKTKGKTSPSNMEGDEDNVESINDDGDAMEVENEENEVELNKSKYEVRERVLARDEDGILYYANIRRKMYGINHQKTISCLGIFDLAPEEINGKKQDEEESNDSNEWHYFVHYEGWKTLWDRWVSEQDILDVTPENLERMKEISKMHKDLQVEFKERTKKKKIDNGGLFLQQWKQRLDALNRRWDEKLQEKENGGKGKKQKTAASKRKVATKKKSNVKSPQEILRERTKLAVESCLIARQPSHIQAIPLSFGLKRILVEDWENLNNGNFAARNNTSDENMDWDMVHVLPAKVTIRDALSLYLKEKGVSWDGKQNHSSNFNTGHEKIENHTDEKTIENEILPKQEEKEMPPTALNVGSSDATITPIKEENSARLVKGDMPNEENNDNENGNGKGISIQLVKEWTDMADGIVLYFEQALMSRLLYPSEISQLLVLEDTFLEDDESKPTPLKADIYGCEHLLRLLSAIPRILDQQLQDSRKRKLERKQKNAKPEVKPDDDVEDAFVEIGSMILAKLQDLSRFLQKNQSALFRSMYRKKNEQEMKLDMKIQKRHEQRLKRAALALAAAASASQNDSQEQDA